MREQRERVALSVHVRYGNYDTVKREIVSVLTIRHFRRATRAASKSARVLTLLRPVIGSVWPSPRSNERTSGILCTFSDIIIGMILLHPYGFVQEINSNFVLIIKVY